MVSQRQIAVLLCLLGLVLANLLIDFWLLSYRIWGLPTSGMFHRAIYAILYCQVLVLGFWLGFGNGKWYWRIVVAIPAAMSIGYSIGLAALANTPADRDYDLFRSHVTAFTFVALLLVVFALLLPVRHILGWRLAWRRDGHWFRPRQFQIGDLLLLMVLIGGVLGIGRFLLTFDSSIGSSLLRRSRDLPGLAAVTWLAIVAAFKQERRLPAAAALIGVSALIGIGYAMPEWIRFASIVGTAHPQTVRWNLLQVFCESMAFLSGGLVVLANCVALRALGYGLGRPDAAVAVIGSRRTEQASLSN